MAEDMKLRILYMKQVVLLLAQVWVWQAGGG